MTAHGGEPAVCMNEGVSHYAVVIHEEPEGGLLGGGARAAGMLLVGESIAELLENIREATAVRSK